MRRTKPESVSSVNHSRAMDGSSSEDGETQAREGMKPRLGDAVFNRKPPKRDRGQKLLEIPSSDSSDEIKALKEENRKLKEYQRMQEERVSSSDTVQDRDSNPRPSVVPSLGSPDHVREMVARPIEAKLAVMMEQQQLLLEAKVSAMLEQQQLLLQQAISPVISPTKIQDPVKETRVRSLLSPEISDKIKSLEEENLRLREEQKLSRTQSINPVAVQDQVLVSGLRSSVSTDLKRQVGTLGAEFLKIQNEGQLVKQSVINPIGVQDLSPACRFPTSSA